MKFKLTRISQNMVAIEVWDEFRLGRFPHLHEAFGDADLICVTNNLLTVSYTHLTLPTKRIV